MPFVPTRSWRRAVPYIPDPKALSSPVISMMNFNFRIRSRSGSTTACGETQNRQTVSVPSLRVRPHIDEALDASSPAVISKSHYHNRTKPSHHSGFASVLARIAVTRRSWCPIQKILTIIFAPGKAQKGNSPVLVWASSTSITWESIAPPGDRRLLTPSDHSSNQGPFVLKQRRKKEL